MPSSNQLATWSDMTSAGVVYQAGGPPGGSAMITASNYNTYIQNDGGYPWGYASNQCMRYDDMNTHKVTITLHSSSFGSAQASSDGWTSRDIGGGFSCSSYPAINQTYTHNSSTVAPTTTGTQLSISFTGVSFSNETLMHISLYNPSSTLVTSFTSSSSSPTFSYHSAGAPAGAWYWVVSENGRGTMTCDSVGGASGSEADVSWTGGSISSYY